MKFLRKFPYWQLLAIPVLLFGLGAGSNQIVLVANHGTFPVMVNKVDIVKMCHDASDVPPVLQGIACTTDGKGGEYLDPVHVIMTPESRLKPLADIFNLGDGIYSIGDFLLMLSFGMVPFAPIAWLVLTLRRLASLIS